MNGSNAAALFGDIKSKRWLIFKGLLFLISGVVASTLILLEHPSLKLAFLLAVTVWCFARSYYFAFYVIERYIDSEYRFSGIGSAVVFLLKRKTRDVASEGAGADDF